MKFNIFSETDVELSQQHILKLAEFVWSSESGPDGEVNLVFVDNERIRELNRTFLNRDDTTDVIAFPFTDTPARFEGEIYLSIDEISINADAFGESFARELDRVVIHGLLHFLGFDDKTLDKKAVMSEKENRYLASFSAHL